MRYMVIVEQGDSSFGAYVPDLPGCVAVGETKEEVLRLIQEAIELHLEDMREEGVLGPSHHPPVCTSRLGPLRATSLLIERCRDSQEELL